MKHKTFLIIFLSLIIILCFVYLGFIIYESNNDNNNNNDTEKEITDCYDRYGNKIIGQQCEVSDRNFPIHLVFLAMIIIFIGFMHI